MSQTGRWRRLTICGLIAGLLYIPALGSPALWEPDEGRYAEIAREMIQSAPGAIQNRAQSLPERTQVGRFIVDRNYDRYGPACRGHALANRQYFAN
jgi:hypothetical protein